MNPRNLKISPEHLKWIVIGILGLTSILVFKNELSSLITNSNEFVVGPEGVRIATETVETPIGETIIAGPPTPETAGINPQSLPNYSSSKGYLINWPQDGSWVEYPDFAQFIGADFVIAYRRIQGNNFPNVNVMVDTLHGMSFREYVESATNTMSNFGFEVRNVEVDDVNNSAVITLYGNFLGLESDAVQRIIFDSGYVYIASAIRPVEFRDDQILSQNLIEILNSFRID